MKPLLTPRHSVLLVASALPGRPQGSGRSVSFIAQPCYRPDGWRPASSASSGSCADRRGAGTAQVGTPNRGSSQTCRTVQASRKRMMVRMLSIVTSSGLARRLCRRFFALAELPAHIIHVESTDFGDYRVENLPRHYAGLQGQ